MTMQIKDTTTYKDEKYELVGLTREFDFKPVDLFGIEAHASCTACWRGFWCEFEVTKEAFLIRNLYIYNKNDSYPPINGRDPEPLSYIECKDVKGKGKSKKTIMFPDNYGHRLYKDIDLIVPFTGKILLGRNEISKYRDAWPQTWSYETLIEVIVEEGFVLDIRDHSYEASQIRAAFEKGDENPSFGYLEEIVRKLKEEKKENLEEEVRDKTWWLEANEEVDEE